METLKAELAELDEALKEAKKLARFTPTLPEKLERQRAARTLEGKRKAAWRAYDEASRESDSESASNGRRTRCSMRSVEDWSSGLSGRRCLCCGGKSNEPRNTRTARKGRVPRRGISLSCVSWFISWSVKE
ncbi:MAG: hypothetical protein AUJ92_10310 [Armatimonadetes bacterium CG2_30_59_28]|nr:MAG: hypothetical protein AUJ92_10310 [Armatimonadetes bacterium CG2_30_59_28]PIU60936.1 MAG: hypothetical protein COS85_22185 [Armatimonadetes bacterium CG07_land_8_20_14_0_80_59_28]